MKKLEKAEKVVLIGGGVIVILMLGLGILKTEYQSDKKDDVQDTAVVHTDEQDDIKLKEDTFIVEAKSKLTTDPAAYIDADEEVLKKVTIDFQDVDVNKLGEYKAIASYGSKEKEIPIEVKDTKPPVITVATTKINFVLGSSSDIKEIQKVADASAEDAVDGVIAEITGWPSKMPASPKSETYTLTAIDKSGNKGTKKITVTYLEK